MKRFIDEALLEWKHRDAESRSPLIVRGARQVGKTYTIEQFGMQHFQNMVSINFEIQRHVISCFTTLEPLVILSRLEIVTRKSIQPGQTLLFLDEIQECPEAIQALRYFKEKIPTLHVIAAGSLLEFVLNDEKFSFPVGRVEYMYLKPLSFSEFLLNVDQGKSSEMLESFSLKSMPDVALHKHYLEVVRQYFFIGGMPAVVQAFIKDSSDNNARRYEVCQRLQSSLLQSYYNDFGKYASKTKHRYLQIMFERAPLLVGQHFKYSAVGSDMRSRELKVALEQLERMGLVQRVYATSASGLPLKSQKKENKCKLLFLDVGLVQNACGMQDSYFFDETITKINEGALAEQFVGQELMACSDIYQNTELYFWIREQKVSKAEVDYVIQSGGKIIPLEVKSGKTGRLKSLQTFMEEKKSPLGLRISQHALSFEKGILSVPFYLIKAVPRMIHEAQQERTGQVK